MFVHNDKIVKDVEGPLMPDRRFETTDWADDVHVWPLLILEYVDGGLDSIYGPYTNSQDLMAGYAHLVRDNLGIDEDTGEWAYDDGYTYDLQPLKGKI